MFLILPTLSSLKSLKAVKMIVDSASDDEEAVAEQTSFSKHVQCGPDITRRIFSKYSWQAPWGRALYGVTFTSSKLLTW